MYCSRYKLIKFAQNRVRRDFTRRKTHPTQNLISVMKVSKDTIKQVIKKEYGEEASSVKFLGGGSFGRAFRVKVGGKVLVVKAFLRSDLCEKEAGYLKILGENCPVKLPEVYFVSLDSPVECYGMELIKGHDAFTNFALLLKPRRQKQRFADAVVEALIALHSHTSPKFGDALDPVYDSWQEYYRPYAQGILNGAEELYRKGRLKQNIYDTLHALWDKYDFIFSDEVKEACLIHGDANVMNIMTNSSLEITGFIDPLNSMYADREYELFQLRNLTGNAFKLYDAYKAKYPVSDKCDLKCAFYALFHELYCYLKNGTYTGFIMRSAVNNAKKQLQKFCTKASYCPSFG